jgi:hypothetical protein
MERLHEVGLVGRKRRLDEDDVHDWTQIYYKGAVPMRTLLGPQRERPTVPRVARELEAPVAVITAGWQENENDALPRGLVRQSSRLGVSNLGIYRRLEQVFDADRELALAHRRRQLRLKELQQLYRLRLDHAVAAYRDLVELSGASSSNGGANDEGSGAESVTKEIDAALETVRALDRHHLGNVQAVHEEFDAEWRPLERDAVALQRRELAEELAQVESVILAGGHVAVLLNRLRLFDLAPLLAQKSIVAWSAGAMVVARTIVLFHDSPPWGAGNGEVLDSGLGLVGNVLPLPDCRRRLRLDDPRRMTLLARRFSTFVCIGLDEASLLSDNGDGWRGRAALRFETGGTARVIGESAWEALAP